MKTGLKIFLPILFALSLRAEEIRHETLFNGAEAQGWFRTGASLVSPQYPARVKSIEIVRAPGNNAAIEVFLTGAKLCEIGSSAASAVIMLDPNPENAVFELRGSAAAPELQSFAAICVDDLLPPPQNVKAIAENTRSIQLSWTKVTGAVGYEVVVRSGGAKVAGVFVAGEKSVKALVELTDDFVELEASVRAVADDAARTSRESDAVALDMELAPVLCAIPLGRLAGGGTYFQDFSTLPVKSSAPWRNGSTLEGWRAFRNGDAVQTIPPTGGRSTAGGLYAVTNSIKQAFALGALSSQGKSVSFGCVFTNDTARTFIFEEASWTAARFSEAKPSVQNLVFGYAVEENLVEPVRVETFEERSEWTFATSAVSKGISAKPEYAAIRPGEVLYLQWRFTPPDSGSSAIAGISSLTVRFTSASSGLAIRIVAR